MRFRIVGAMTLFAFTAVAAPARAQVQSAVINPLADAFVTSAKPDSNYGGAGALGVAAGGLPKGEFDALMRFDTAGAKSTFDAAYGAGNWTVQSIALRLAATPPNNSIFNGNAAGPGATNVNTAGLFSVNWMAIDSWSEGGGNPNAPGGSPDVTFTNQPVATNDQSLGVYTFAGGTSGSTTYLLPSSTGVQFDVQSATTLGLRLLPADSSVAYLFNSKTGATQPQLTITAIPEPMTAGVFTFLLCLGVRSWRRA